MEVSVSGVRVSGSWDEIVRYGMAVSNLLTEYDVPTAQFVQWDRWRPKPHESLHRDLVEKTAHQASVQRGAGERRGRDPVRDFRRARDIAQRSTSHVRTDTPRASAKLLQSLRLGKRGIDASIRKLVRVAEEWVYENVMVRVSPLYFSSEAMTANLGQTGGVWGSRQYVMEVKLNEDALHEQFVEDIQRRMPDM
jgi:hypothetical protein